MATQSTVLWKCGACEDCFCDLQAFAGHKCLNHQGPALTEFKNLDENAFADAEIVNTSSDQVEQVVSAIAALEENSGGSLDQDVAETTFSISGKRKRKAKPTIISINNSSLVANKKFKKGKRSLVWTYFSALDHKKAMCCICQKVIPNPILNSHLRFEHPGKFLELQRRTEELKTHRDEQKHAQEKIQTNSEIPSTSMNSETKEKSLNDKIINFLITDLLPISSVNEPGFRQFIMSFVPMGEIPSSDKIINKLLPDRYCMELRKVKNELKLSNTVNLSAEIWSGYEGRDFLSLTAHFFCSDFNLKSYTLTTSYLGIVYDSQKIVTSINNCFLNWGLDDKVTFIVTDGSSRLNEAVLLVGKKSISCFAHTLNSILRDAMVPFGGLKEFIEKCRRFAEYLKINGNVNVKLMIAQVQQGGPCIGFGDFGIEEWPIHIKKDDPKYWVTTFRMLQNMYVLRNIIDKVFDEMPSDVKPFEPWDWFDVRSIRIFLEAFEIVIVQLCRKKFPLLSDVIPRMQKLLCMVASDDPVLPYLEELQKHLLHQMPEKMGKLEENVIFAMAIILDPGCKKDEFESTEAFEAAIQEITSRGREYMKQHLGKNSSVDESSSSHQKGFKKKTAKNKTFQSNDAINKELKQYLAEPTIDDDMDIMIWWNHIGSKRFPILAEIAKSILSIPATCAPPKQIFMGFEEPFCERRKNIKPEQVDEILFLNKIFNK